MLKRNEVLNFEEGLLTIKVSGHGTGDGWATLAFREDQFELDADGYQVVEIAPSELRELRDFLNRVVPTRSTLLSPAPPQAGRKLPTASAMQTALGYMRSQSAELQKLATTVSGSGEGAEIYADAVKCIEFALALSRPVLGGEK